MNTIINGFSFQLIMEDKWGVASSLDSRYRRIRGIGYHGSFRGICDMGIKFHRLEFPKKLLCYIWILQGL